MKLAQVILDIPTQSLDTPYTYLVGADAADADYPIAVGAVVVVPFGHRQATGFVVSIDEYDDAAALPAGLEPAKLKCITRAVSASYFDEEGAACAQWLSERYIAPLSACVRLFTPPGGAARMVRAREGYWRLEQPQVGAVDDRWVRLGPAADDFVPRKNAVKQAAIINTLRKGELRVAELSLQFSGASGVLKTLAEKDVVVIERRRRMRGVPDHTGERLVMAPPEALGGSLEDAEGVAYAHAFVPSAKPQLTAGQTRALAAIGLACDNAAGEVVCVDGVTGSGKTEVYLQAIERVLNAGKSAIVLVPEISLTPQTVARFRGRFGDLVAVMHSRMSAGERFDQWDFIRSGAARVVVGARSALFTPLANVGLIIIDEEHEGSYKQDSAPRYHARDVAVWMAERAGAAVVLGSATLSLEALYEAKNNPAWHYVSLPERANGRPMPEVQVIDMAKEFRGGSRAMFSRALATALEEELAAGHKAVLLLNQRGFAKFVLCRDCGFVPECPSCSTSLTFHERGNFLICHHCGYRISAPARCPECGSPYLKKFGAGTQRVEDDLRALISGFRSVAAPVPVIRMDADTTAAKGAHERLLDQFAAADAAVLLGTQMIAKGLDFDDVTLVGVINADTMLKLPDYRAAERTFDLVEQVAGRAGRAQLPGRVLVQTYEAACAPIRAASTYDRALFLADELPKRETLGYPPYVRLANVLVWGKNEADVRRECEALREAVEARVRDYGQAGWQVLAATPCVLAKLRGTYRWHIVVKCPLADAIAPVLLPLFRARKAVEGVSVAVDVDPQDLL